ncbi:MAG: hypothetical protein JWO94_3544 [Verrucomicrobiaceae bacterium]|nr:hypothetical protein [Verrucomicrobiaceae bacterium]
MSFTFFNSRAPLEITQKRLPHWEQGGATYFITFRTADSIPRDVLTKWLDERSHWLSQHGIEGSKNDWQQQLESLSDSAKYEYHRTLTMLWHEHLDNCHGACLLRQAELAQIVADALLHFDGQRYHISDFVIMPNHVHVLVGVDQIGDMRRLCRSWKKYSATQINNRLRLKGEFWQSDSFDHLVRNENSYLKFRRYIADNPVKAQLGPGEYHLWQSSPLPQSSTVTP